MINKENKKKPLKSLVGVLILSAIATACSNGNSSSNSSNSSNNENGDVSSLQLIAPRTIYSLPSGIGTGYMVVNNPTNKTVKNLHYSLTNQVGSGQQVVIDSVSADACAEVAAYSQCNVKVIIPAGAVAGSVGYVVDNSDTNLLSRLGKVLKADATNNIMASGIEQAAYNKLSGADGITLSYYHTVINGTPYILVSGLVASANAGTFNKIVLVNGGGTVLPNQELISPVSNAQGSTFSILLPIPSGNNISQIIKVQTQQDNTAVSTATSSSTLTTTQNVGIAEMLPSAVYLTTANPEQIITFANTGDAIAQLQQLVSNNPNVEIVFNPGSLSSGSTSTATLKLKDKTVAVTSGDVTLTYNNGQTETSTSGTVDQNVNPTPSPSPTPSPTPGPAPAPTPSAALTAVFSPDNNFFTTTTVGTVSRQLTLTNSGNTDEDAIVLTLPANFTISGGSSNSCTVTQGSSPATISNTLAVGSGNCDVTVTYTNSGVTSLGSDNISIAYNYNNGIAAPTPTSAAVNYKVTQSTANLSLTPNTAQTYSSIVSDNTAVSTPISYTLTNSGDETASSLAFNFTGTNSGLFHSIAGGTCTSGGSLSSTSGSNSCTINTQFGPAANGSAGAKTAAFNVSYIPYTGAGTTNTPDVSLSGTVTAAPSATFTSAVTGNTFTGGSGTSGAPYTGYTSTAYTVSVTYTNNSSIPATGFTTAYTTLPTGWTMSTHGCNNVSMAATSGTCTDVYTLNSALTGTTSINLGNVTASWNDNSGTYNNQAIQGSTVYANLSVRPAITITPVTTTWNTMMGSAYAFTATISGGSSTVTPTVTGLTGNTLSPASCALNDAAQPPTTSCTFIITPYTGIGNYSFWNPASVANSTNVNTPSNAYTPVTNISLQVSAGNGATINGNPSPQTFSNITGTVIAPYVYLPQTGQTPTAPLDVTATTGADGNVHVGIPWAYVSSGSTAPTPRFEEVDSGECIKDNLTGLIWVKDLNTVNGGVILTWESALSIAAGGQWCSQAAGTWRVPNINELASLINYSEANLANWLNTSIANGGAGFSSVTSGAYWSSSSDATNPTTKAWRANMNNGTIATSTKITSTNLRLFPVRGGQ
jgi:hypothetical protein